MYVCMCIYIYIDMNRPAFYIIKEPMYSHEYIIIYMCIYFCIDKQKYIYSYVLTTHKAVAEVVSKKAKLGTYVRDWLL